MTTCTLRAIPANGATLLRSDLAQDRRVKWGDMFAAVRAKFPTAEWCNAFRTFDGDVIVQFSVSGRVAPDYADLTF